MRGNYGTHVVSHVAQKRLENNLSAKCWEPDANTLALLTVLAGAEITAQWRHICNFSKLSCMEQVQVLAVQLCEYTSEA